MTIREIAKLANVSRGTVDRVVNHRGMVSPEAEARVEKVLKETGYLPKHRSKGEERSPLDIGVIIASRNNSFFDVILQGMKAALKGKYRYSRIRLHVFPVRLFNDEDVLKALHSLPKKTRMLIISADGTEKIRREIDALDIPVITVSIDLQAAKKIGFVGCDFRNSGELAADMANLLARPGDKIQVFLGSFSHQGHRERLAGFTEKLSSNVRPLSPVETFDDDKIGYERTKDSLRENEPDLLVYFGAGMIGGLRAVREFSGKKPRIITVDEIPEILKGLKDGEVAASISQHPYSQGKKCIEVAYRWTVGDLKEPVSIHVANSVILKDSLLPYGGNGQGENEKEKEDL
jgi:LacI family transcriptional regulator